ncbi:hypothetical protein ACHMW5_02495 [Azospirillum melinis]|uniref:hypothetical protein n=1 Tax=Azospirillum melinis TaxID=328839 RepID=UPI003756DAB1
MHPRPAMDPRPDDEITRSRSREAMRRDEPTHQTDQRPDRLALGDAIKRIGH